MGNKKIIGGVVGIIVIGAILYFAMAKKNTEPAMTDKVDSSSQTTPPAAPAAAGPQSLKDLLGLGASRKCTFSNAGSSGTIYVSSGKMRGDFISTVGGKNMTNHMMTQDKTSYVWVEGQTQGFKTTMDESMMQKPTTPAPQTPPTQGGVDINQKLNYQCESWSADSSMFSLPANVKFLDFSSMMHTNQ